MLPLKFPLFPHYAPAPYSVFSLSCFTFCDWVPHFFSQIFSILLVSELSADLGMSYFLHFFCFVFLNGCHFCFVFLMWFWVPISHTILCEILLNVEDSGASICFEIWVLFGCWENVGKEKGMTVLKGLDFFFSFLLSVLYFCLHHMGLH